MIPQFAFIYCLQPDLSGHLAHDPQGEWGAPAQSPWRRSSNLIGRKVTRKEDLDNHGVTGVDGTGETAN